MKKFQALELLRLVTFLPLLVVVVAMLNQEQYNSFQQPGQIVSQEQSSQTTYFWEG